MAEETFKEWLLKKHPGVDPGRNLAARAIAMEGRAEDLEDYDDAVRYPITTEEYAAEVGQKLDASYHDPNQGWSDPCPQFCPQPACKQQCNGRDSSDHEEHSCGHHVWIVRGGNFGGTTCVWQVWIQQGEKMYTNGTVGGPMADDFHRAGSKR